MRIIFNAFNNKNKQQHIIGNIDVVMKKEKSFSNVEFEYKLKNGYVFMDHFLEDGMHKSYLYKYCYFEHDSVYGEELKEKPIMLPQKILTDQCDRLLKLQNQTDIEYINNHDILYIAFVYPFPKTQTIEKLTEMMYDKAVNKLTEYVKENNVVREKINDIYMNENRVYLIYERFYTRENDEELDYQIKLLGYTTNKELADEIFFNGYFSGRDIIVTDELPKIQGVIFEKPRWIYVEVEYEEDKIEEIVGLKKSVYFNFKFIQPNQKCSKLLEPSLATGKIPLVQYEKNAGHFYFRMEITRYMDRQELSQVVQDTAINYILFRKNYENNN